MGRAPSGGLPQQSQSSSDYTPFAGRQPSAESTLLTPDDAKRKRALDEETKLRVQVDIDKDNACQKAVKATETEANQSGQIFASECTKANGQLNQAKTALDARLRDVSEAFRRTETELKTLAGLKDFVAAGELGDVRNELEETARSAREGIERAGEGLTGPVEASLGSMIQKFDEEVGQMEAMAQGLIAKIQESRYR